MAKGNILKEAIADAKAVREVALVNAKAALEEAFTPKLQNMLSAKLSEDLDEDYYEEDMDEDMDEMMYDEDMMEKKEEDPKLDIPKGLDDKDMLEDNSMDEEIDLEEILNELELEEDKSLQTEEEEEVNEEREREDDSNEELSEEFDLDSLLNEINSLDKKPKRPLRSKAPKRASRPKSIRENKNIRKSYKRNKNVSKIKTLKESGCRSTKHELSETKKALTKVRGELNEVNLLNSKLLYVNRIFKQNDLDDAQKLRVVETLDKAGTTKEAKLIYETIKDSFNISNEVIENEIKKEIRNSVKRTPKKSIRENYGMASKAAGLSTAPKKSVLNESNDMVSRMQKLANIKINQ